MVENILTVGSAGCLYVLLEWVSVGHYLPALFARGAVAVAEYGISHPALCLETRRHHENASTS